MDKKIRVLLADDHEVVRLGLKLLLEQTADIEVIGQAENGRKAVSMAVKLVPNIIILDITMPLLNGIEAARQIRSSCSSIKIIFLSGYINDHHLERLAQIEDVDGFVEKQLGSRDMIRAIRKVYGGETFFSRTMTTRLHTKFTELLNNMKNRGDHLTLREAEILQLVAEGYANKQIAAELGMSIKTVEKHRQKVMNKLNRHDVVSLTKFAVTTGVIGDRPRLHTDWKVTRSV